MTEVFTTTKAEKNAHVAKAEDLCKKADEQKKNFDAYSTEISVLKEELSVEESTIAQFIKDGDLGSTIAKLQTAHPKITKTMIVLDRKLKTLLASQVVISDAAVSFASELTSELHQTNVTLTDTKEKHTQASKLATKKHEDEMNAKNTENADAKQKHDEAMEAKNQEHAEAKKKLSKDHAVRQKALQTEKDNAAATHGTVVTAMVTVNKKFLDDVQAFVESVRILVHRRIEFESVFSDMEKKIVDINVELNEFSKHVGPKDAHLAVGPAKQKPGR